MQAGIRECTDRVLCLAIWGVFQQIPTVNTRRSEYHVQQPVKRIIETPVASYRSRKAFDSHTHAAHSVTNIRSLFAIAYGNVTSHVIMALQSVPRRFP